MCPESICGAVTHMLDLPAPGQITGLNRAIHSKEGFTATLLNFTSPTHTHTHT